MNLLRIYNQNRRKIWYGIAVVGIVIIFYFTFNRRLDDELKNKAKTENEQKYLSTEYKENPDAKVTISNAEVEKNTELIIDQFIRYCNAGEVENAYSLLSEDCKKYIYPTIDYFKQKYINKYYNTTKLYKKEYYSKNTYKLYFYDDMLSTGKVSNTAMEDYYTIKKNGNDVKLNISRIY